MAIIYGPVASWRLGRSLGIDLLNTRSKICSFNCIYCQLGEASRLVTEPTEFIGLEELNRELRSMQPIEADFATFSGMGEPTLAANLGEAIDLARPVLSLPIAVLTNCSLMFREDVKQRLARADVVVAKLDAPNEEVFSLVNRPAIGLSFSLIVDGMRRFRDTFRGKLALQIMFVKANEANAREIADLAGSLSPDEVQINTPLRPCNAQPLPPNHLARIHAQFRSLARVVNVYEASVPEASSLDPAETLRRRPDADSKASGSPWQPD